MFLDKKYAYFVFYVPTTTLLDLGFQKSWSEYFEKTPPKIQKTDILNTKMVEIDPKSLETKSLKISASEVLHIKRYSNLKNRGGRFVPPRDE